MTAAIALATNDPHTRLAEVGGVAQEDAQRRVGGDAAGPRGADRIADRRIANVTRGDQRMPFVSAASTAGQAGSDAAGM
jgi:hypothetical protein